MLLVIRLTFEQVTEDAANVITVAPNADPAAVAPALASIAGPVSAAATATAATGSAPSPAAPALSASELSYYRYIQRWDKILTGNPRCKRPAHGARRRKCNCYLRGRHDCFNLPDAALPAAARLVMATERLDHLYDKGRPYGRQAFRVERILGAGP
ncbi:hypothetical protein DTO271G3_8727 [Paecilomyces variotii]|nr:hypothetical protein DTO271G3_8727 [Paecilomyces variotii]